MSPLAIGERAMLTLVLRFIWKRIVIEFEIRF
jgi:hypothetical protein